jgi:hypothetical protein
MNRAGRITSSLAAVAVLALCAVSLAAAARDATPAERGQLFRASAHARDIREHAPSRCAEIVMRVSGSFALVEPRFALAPRCARFASNGYELFRRTPPSWTRVFVGSDPPPCSYGVPRDLVRCLAGHRHGPNYRRATLELARRGYRPGAVAWDEQQRFNAVTATRKTGSPRRRVFFFLGSALVAVDTRLGSADVALAWRGDEVIALRYRFRGPPACRLARMVRFVLRHGRVVPLDRVPPVVSAAGCRR